MTQLPFLPQSSFVVGGCYINGAAWCTDSPTEGTHWQLCAMEEQFGEYNEAPYNCGVDLPYAPISAPCPEVGDDFFTTFASTLSAA